MVRSSAVFEGAPRAQTAVAVVGAITLLLGAVIGSAKDDMKKVLAASTMSQIGYMMLGAGLGPVGYAFAIFHLLTHGFFKAQLFLGAGSVMHAMSDQVDMRRFGALAKVMRITWITMAIGWLAILGIPPFSGFWSKDRIIEAAFVGEGARPWILGTIALLGAGLTAFYMSRLFFMIFHGSRRWTTEADPQGPVRPHESGWLMTAPLVVLSVFSLGLGWALARCGRAGSCAGAAGTWLSRFAWESPETGWSTHCFEVPFAFDCLAHPYCGHTLRSAPPQALADAVHGDWARFILTGDPGWEPWDERGLGRTYGDPRGARPDGAVDGEVFAVERRLLEAGERLAEAVSEAG